MLYVRNCVKGARAAVMLLAVGSALSLATSAQATFFSFASDNNSNSFTFAGTAGAGGSFTINESTRPTGFNLLIDDNNGSFASVSIPVEFRANFVASNHVGIAVGSITHHS